MFSAILLIAGCGGDRLYTGPMEAPAAINVGDGEFTAFAVRVFEGERAPMDVSSILARCSPASTCAATVSESRVLVFGIRQGVATIELDLKHPITGRRQQRSVRVTVGEPTRPTAVAVGSPLSPSVGTSVAISVADGSVRCESRGPRGDIIELACVVPKRLTGSGDRSWSYARTESRFAIPPATIRGCAITVDDTVTSMAIAQPVGVTLGPSDERCAELVGAKK